jgi:uncharacterized protein YgbK (DUF1537 family)
MITVLADDITGAAEIAGVCLRYGLQVSFGIDSVPTTPAEVHIIATDSRSATEIEAYTIHKKLATDIFASPDSFVYKKCDSVLRGFVLTELYALMEVSSKNNVILQPANPETSRCIHNGQYYIGDELIEKTGFAIDPDFPAFCSDVRTLLTNRSPLVRNSINISSNTPEAQSCTVHLEDCDSIESLSKSAKNINRKYLYAGSSAFFEEILKTQLHLSTTQVTTKRTIKTEYLLIAGSTHPQSHKHIELLSSKGCPVYYFPEELLKDNVSSVVMEKHITQLIETWNIHRKLILSVSDKKVTFQNSSTILRTRISYIASKMLSHCSVKELLIEGGATAYDLLKNLNWQALNPIEEISSGVIRMGVTNIPDIHISIKPGSYLWPDNFID